MLPQLQEYFISGSFSVQISSSAELHDFFLYSSLTGLQRECASSATTPQFSHKYAISLSSLYGLQVTGGGADPSHCEPGLPFAFRLCIAWPTNALVVFPRPVIPGVGMAGVGIGDPASSGTVIEVTIPLAGFLFAVAGFFIVLIALACLALKLAMLQAIPVLLQRLVEYHLPPL